MASVSTSAFLSRRRVPFTLPWWFLVLLAAYAVLELSFNHHLMQVSAGADAELPSMEDLEFWGRLISGLGLAFWLIRSMLRRHVPVALAMLLSVAIGVTAMWNLQRWLIDAIVARASESEKRMSLVGQQLAGEALAGRVQVRGLPLVQPEQLTDASRPAWRALLPAITLGLAPQDLQPTDPQVLLRVGRATPVGADVLPQLTEAYRRVVTVPVALGVSLIFGLANLCLLLSLLAQRCLPQLSARRSAWLQRSAFAGLLALALAWSWVRAEDGKEPAGFREVARPALRAEQPLLAPFVEWSLRAEPAWHGATRWVHLNLLGDYGFRRPGVVSGFSV